MKSKFTLRLDARLKEKAKDVARRKGTSVSKLVEEYFRILEGGEKKNEPDADLPSLPPRIQELKDELGQPAPQIQVDDDTRAWIKAAAEKHA